MTPAEWLLLAQGITGLDLSDKETLTALGNPNLMDEIEQEYEKCVVELQRQAGK